MEGQPTPPRPPPRSRLRPPTRALSNSEVSAAMSEPEEKKMTKRQHALLELLSSERAYASDLALMREIHIPLALGRPVSIVPSSLKLSTNESSRSVSTGSSSSASSSASSQPSVSTTATSPGQDMSPLPGSSIDLTSDTPSSFVFDPSLGPPMTPHSTKIIFSNISELAVLADLMSEGLEEAIGVDNEFEGRDRVGEFFLRVATDLEGPYTRYITRHPIALAHLHSLTSSEPSPALQSYLQLTRVLSTSFTHAWDIQSLLIKPVQRLLKYSLLLQAIIDETPSTHPDLAALKSAKTRMEEISRSVNEERRKAEVVRGVLGLDEDVSKRPSVMMGVGVHVLPPNIMLKTLKNSSPMLASDIIEPSQDLANPEAALIDITRKRLVAMTQFAHTFAAAIMDWQQAVKVCMEKLKLWALGFARVLGLSVPVQYLVDPSGLDPTISATSQGGGESEAFNAFLALITSHLLPLTSTTLHGKLTTTILTPLSTLLTSTKSPQKLLSSLSSLEPYHTYLLNMPLSAKNRPPQSLLDASRDYVALRSILSRELPQFVSLMERGVDASVKEFVQVQKIWYSDLRGAWRGLWDCLRVDGESLFPDLGTADGGEGTIENWSLRFTEVAVVVSSLKSVRPPPRMTEKEKERERRRELERERERVKDLEKRERQLREMLVTIGAEGPPVIPASSGVASPPAKEKKPETPRRPSATSRTESHKKREREKSPPAPPVSKATGVTNALFALDPGHAPKSPVIDNSSNGSIRSKPRSAEHLSTSGSGGKRRSSATSSRGRSRHGSVGEGDRPRTISGHLSSDGEGSPVVERGRERPKLPPVLDVEGIAGTLPPAIASPSLSESSSSHKRSDSTSTKKESPIYFTAGVMGPSSPTYFAPPMMSPSTSSLLSSSPSLMTSAPSTGTVQSYFSSSSTLAPMVTKETPNGSRFGFGLMKSKSNLKDKEEKARQKASEKEKRDREKTEREQKERERWERESHRFLAPQNQDHMFLDMGPVLPPVKTKKTKEEKEAEKEEREKKSRESTYSSSTNSSGKTEKRGLRDRFSLSARPSSSSGPKNSKGKDKGWSDWGGSGTILGVSMSNGSTPSHTEPGSPAWSSVKDLVALDDSEFYTSQSAFAPTFPPSQLKAQSALYSCKTVHPMRPPPGATYKSMPFLQLELGDFVVVVEEIGHPRDLERHAIPFEVDEGDECLLLVRRQDTGEEGWALASFLTPL